jgi:ferredoxin
VAEWSVTIDRELCIGSGVCIVYAPNTFEHDAEGKSTRCVGEPDDASTVRTAVEGCPTSALAFEPGGNEY